jgi:hypothetical protein
VADPGAVIADELFVYKDDVSAESWARAGWTEAHGNDMVHFLVTTPQEADRLVLTVVVDSPTGDVRDILIELEETVWSMASGGVSSPGRRRVNWEKELRAVGYEAGRDRFYDTVGQFRTHLYPDWTPDDLACHPIQAIHFCEEVRRHAGVAVPDHLVMKALLDLRKRGSGESAFRPRLSWAHG